jgi:predicted metal-dependent peptidase
MNKIDKAKTKLMLENPYFGSIASMLKIEPNDHIESFSSDGEHYFYNDAYINELEIEEVGFTLANAAMHYALAHKQRGYARQDTLWQLATDYAINAMLVKNIPDYPPRINYQKRFDGMYAEEIYTILESETEHKEEDDTACSQKEQRQKQEPMQDDSMFLDQLFEKIKQQGDLPKEFTILFDMIYSDVIDWRTELQRYLDRHAKEDYRFSPPNKKFLHLGYSLPALSSETLRITVAIDTSGSIDRSLLAQFFAELSSIMESFPNYEIELIEVDAKIQSHTTFYPGEPITYQVTGGGGTDFRVLFEYLSLHLPHTQAVIYFTDGHGTFPTKPPPYDTLWVMPQTLEVPFGKVIQIA